MGIGGRPTSGMAMTGRPTSGLSNRPASGMGMGMGSMLGDPRPVSGMGGGFLSGIPMDRPRSMLGDDVYRRPVSAAYVSNVWRVLVSCFFF
jgi:hypothetical protein